MRAAARFAFARSPAGEQAGDVQAAGERDGELACGPPKMCALNDREPQRDAGFSKSVGVAGLFGGNAGNRGDGRGCRRLACDRHSCSRDFGCCHFGGDFRGVDFDLPHAAQVSRFTLSFFLLVVVILRPVVFAFSFGGFTGFVRAFRTVPENFALRRFGCGAASRPDRPLVPGARSREMKRIDRRRLRFAPYG